MVVLRVQWVNDPNLEWKQVRGSVATLVAALAMIAAIVPAAGAAVPVARATGSWAQMRSGFTSTMPDRFDADADADGDGLVDLPNTTEYVNRRAEGSCPRGCGVPLFDVRLDARLAMDGRARDVDLTTLPITHYLWDIEVPGSDAPLHHVTTLPRVDLLLAEGEYRATVTIVARGPFGPIGLPGTQTLVVEDVLVVAIGDSYAAGDGSPERARQDGDPQWADAAVPSVAEQHRITHRSTVAWPSRMALAIEQSNPATSVTFVSLAASGATIRRGLLAPRGGLPSQLDQLVALVGERQIDILVMSVGGNDVGFGPIIEGLVDADPLWDPICYDMDVTNLLHAVFDGDWRRTTGLRWSITSPFRVSCRERIDPDGSVVAGLRGLPQNFDHLAAAVTSRLDPSRVLLMEYPDPTGGPSGECKEIVGDAAPLGVHEIDGTEQALGRDRVLQPLNAVLQAAAARHGWTVAAGVAESFSAGHGYCAAWPDYGYPKAFESRPWFLRDRLDFPSGWYRNPGAAPLDSVDFDTAGSWYRTAGQSASLQGPSTRHRTTGTMHPNEFGHAAMAKLALAALGLAG